MDYKPEVNHWLLGNAHQRQVSGTARVWLVDLRLMRGASCSDKDSVGELSGQAELMGRLPARARFPQFSFGPSSLERG